VREKPTKLSGYERPFFAKLPKIKIEYKRSISWGLLCLCVISIIILRYYERANSIMELGLVLTASLAFLWYYFNKFWKTYEKASYEARPEEVE